MRTIKAREATARGRRRAGSSVAAGRRKPPRSKVALARCARQNAALAAVAKRALADGELDPLLEAAVDEVATTLRADICGVIEGGPGVRLRTRTVWHRSTKANSQGASSPVLPVDRGLGSTSRGDRRRCNSDVPGADGDRLSTCVVIAAEEEHWGLLWVRRRTGRFTADEGRFLEEIANILGRAIMRSQLARCHLQHQARLRQVLQHSPGVVVSFLPASPFPITFMSENALAIYGFPPEDFYPGNLWLSRVHPDDKAIALGGLAELPVHGTTSFDCRFRHRDERWIWLRNHLTLLLETAGAPAEVVGISLDVTDLRQLEAELRQAQKMEAVGRLAGGVAHDFNNLLTAINGYSEILLLTLHEEDPSRRDVEEILRAGERAATLTRQLLTFSRRQVLQPQVVDLNVVVADTERLLRRLIGEDVVLHTSMAQGPALVMGDPGQLEQVVLNLAVNARDAMPAGGVLSVESCSVEILAGEPHAPEARPGSWVVLRVTDDGCGMSEEVVPHIFEPFFTTKELGKGTGLGLSTIYGIVQEGGGWVEVDTAAGRGSVFSVYLPRVEAVVERVMTDLPSRAATGTGKRVMVVEDELAVRVLIARALRSQGHEVLEAENGEEAVAIANADAGAIDVLITDVVMPKLRGPQLRQRLIEQRPGLLTLFISGYTDPDVTTGIDLDGAAFMQKPFTPISLARRVRELLDKAAVPSALPQAD